jgi:Coenzyme PQQ synthesis protein D (PqqD)
MAWQTIDGETVLLNLDGRELMGLNGVGARAWELLDGERSLAQIAAAVAEEFEVEPAQAEADVLVFAGELLAAGAVEKR